MIRARDNPFRVERLHALAFRAPCGRSPADLLDRWETLGRRGAIIGPHGSGKTTLLTQIKAELTRRGQGYHDIRLNIDQQRPTVRNLRPWLWQIPRGDTVIVDGADLLGWAARRVLLGHDTGGGGLLITTHGRHLLNPVIATQTSAALLRELLGELVGQARAQAIEPTAARLLDQHGGNIRMALRSLYDLCANDQLGWETGAGGGVTG